MPTAAKPAESTTPPAEEAAAAVPTFNLAEITDENTVAGRQIARALQLEKERAELGEKIAKNRDYLRLMDGNEDLTDPQADWLDTFYPEKEKGSTRSKEEIEATRKAKEQARKL